MANGISGTGMSFPMAARGQLQEEKGQLATRFHVHQTEIKQLANKLLEAFIIKNLIWPSDISLVLLQNCKSPNKAQMIR